jgi:hypothetical protein
MDGLSPWPTSMPETNSILGPDTVLYTEFDNAMNSMDTSNTSDNVFDACLGYVKMPDILTWRLYASHKDIDDEIQISETLVHTEEGDNTVTALPLSLLYSDNISLRLDSWAPYGKNPVRINTSYLCDPKYVPYKFKAWQKVTLGSKDRSVIISLCFSFAVKKEQSLMEISLISFFHINPDNQPEIILRNPAPISKKINGSVDAAPDTTVAATNLAIRKKLSI